MRDAIEKITGWAEAGEPMLFIVAGTVVAACFVVFSALRLLLYLPQIKTCWNDANGCSAINLVTWCSWVASNTSTGLYMWMFQGDAFGMLLFLANAAMCAITVAITVLKRQRRACLEPT